MKTMFLIAAVSLLGFTAIAGAENPAGAPYGVCPLCDTYGNCKRPLTYEEAVSSVESYYEGRGMKAVVTKRSERFLEAAVYKSSAVVDKVLMDRKTGRIRSIYY
jgi:hypothetical protein